ncbi:MAG: hypothetical protein K1X75_18145 [Leptospirales bacterium]|nr:hypothetical protein [Leptospirales bacterium]
MLQNQVVRIRLRSESGMYYLGALLFTPDGGGIKEYQAVAGDRGEFRDRPMQEPYSQFSSWKDTLIFSGNLDRTSTSDFDRCLGRLSRRHDFVERFRKVAEGRANDGVLYDIQTEMFFNLGIRGGELKVEAMPLRVVEPVAAEVEETAPAASESDPRLAGRLPLRFLVSAVRGLPLSELQAGMDVFVRFGDPESVEARQYRGARSGSEDAAMASGDDMEQSLQLIPSKEEAELEAQVSAVEHTDQGVLVLLELPGGVQGYVLEEEPLVKIKLPAAQQAHIDASRASEKAGAQKKAPATTAAGAISLAELRVPLAIAAGGLTLILAAAYLLLF